MSDVIMTFDKDEAYFYFKGYSEDHKFAIYFYLNGEKVKTEWYKQSRFLRIKGYDDSYTCKVFVRDKLDNLVSQFYLKNQISSAEKGMVLQDLQNELINIGEVKNTYTVEDRSNYENTLVILWMLSIIDNKSTTYLLKICSLIKGWIKTFNSETLIASKYVLERKERTDAVIYYCFSLLAVLPWDEAKIEINQLYSNLREDNNLNICRVFLALFSFEDEDFDGYCQIIDKILKSKNDDFNHYIFTPLSTVYTKNHLSNCTLSDIQNKLFDYNLNLDVSYDSDEANLKYVVSLSCNKKYFDLYYVFILDTLKKHCKDCAIFIFFSDGDADYYKEKLSKYSNVYFFINSNINNFNIGPISSVLRYYYAYDLLERFKLPVFVLDFDSIVFKDLYPLIESISNHDIASRILKKGVLPWEKYTGGFTIFNPTPFSVQMCLEIKFLTEKMLTNDKVQWWIDQNILEAAIRQIKYRKYDFKIFNAISIRDNYIKMPVGKTETKIFLMNKMYDESMAN